LTRKTYLCGLITAFFVIVVATGASAAEGGERRGEVGIQLGIRWVDRDIVPDDSRGLGYSPGVAGALTRFRMTNVTFLVGWGAGIGKRL